MCHHRPSVGGADAFVDRGELPLLDGDKILHRLGDQPGFRPVEGGRDGLKLFIQRAVQPDADGCGLADAEPKCRM